MRPHFLLACLFSLGFAAAAESPAEAAVKFCEALRDGKEQAQVIAYSALNPQTGDIKKAKIFAQWKRDAQALLPRPFEIAEEQVRGDQAAVILSQWEASDGHRMQLSLVACTKREGKWLACPVMGSFENSNVRYDPSILRDRQALTSWMHAREIHLREQWQMRVRQQWHERMSLRVSPSSLTTIEPKALLQDLLAGIRARDQAATLARLGGFSQDAVQDWPRIERKIHQVFSSDAWNQWPWKLLSSKQSILALGSAHELGDETVIEALVLHPDSLSEEPDFLSFSIFRDDQGRARIQLPEAFWLTAAAEEELGEIMDCDSPEHRQLYRSIRRQARRSWNNAPIEQPEALADIVEKSLQQSDFPSFWGAGSLAAQSADELLEMPAIIGLWKKLHGSTTGECLFGRVGFQVHKRHALLAMQSYSPGQQNPLVHHKIWFEKRGKEWFLCDAIPQPTPDELLQWWNDQKNAWSEKMADSIIEQCTRIGGLAPLAPQEEQVREVFASWLRAAEKRELSALLPFCAAFQDERSIKAMLQHLARTLQQGGTEAQLMSIRTHGRWTTVSAKIPSSPSHTEVFYPMHVFVVTDDGPRLLPQMDLKLTDQENPSRHFLNQLTLRDLKKFLPDAAVGELQHLYEAHHAEVKALRTPSP